MNKNILNEKCPWPRAAIDQHALRKYAMAARTRNTSWMGCIQNLG